MKDLFFYFSMLFSQPDIDFNGQSFNLMTSNCMTVYKGERCYSWQIVSYSNAAEEQMAREISDKIALERCRFLTTKCSFYSQVCSN